MMAAFIIQIHLLNMLIAIMGDTFARRSESVTKIYYKDHLRFVLDNWHLLKNALGKNIKDVKYIIAALPTKDEDEEEVMAEVYDKIKDQERIIKNFQKSVMTNFDNVH